MEEKLPKTFIFHIFSIEIYFMDMDIYHIILTSLNKTGTKGFVEKFNALIKTQRNFTKIVIFHESSNISETLILLRY